jgi:hypothetical protein
MSTTWSSEVYPANVPGAEQCAHLTRANPRYPSVKIELNLNLYMYSMPQNP